MKIKIGFITKAFLLIAVRIIGKIAKKATPEIRQEIEKFILEWEKKCKSTKNKWDDIIVEILKGIFQIGKASK